jgi:predicted nucleic acid-binding protein
LEKGLIDDPFYGMNELKYTSLSDKDCVFESDFSVSCDDLKKEHLFSTLELEAKDFEDALQYYCACDNDCDIIVTRNKKDFDFSTIEVLTPEEFLQKY